MPNTSPTADSASTIRLINDIVAESANVRVYQTGCITEGRRGEKLAPIGSLAKLGVRAISDDGSCVQSAELMRNAMVYAKMFGLFVMDHCQEATLTKSGQMHEGEWSVKLGLGGWPSAAEDIIVSRDVILAHYAKCHIHLQHISSALSVERLGGGYAPPPVAHRRMPARLRHQLQNVPAAALARRRRRAD